LDRIIERQPSNGLIPEFCTRYRSEALKPLGLKRSWSDFDPQAQYHYGEDQNRETSFKTKGLQAGVDGWCKIQVIFYRRLAGIIGERMVFNVVKALLIQ